MLTYNQHIKLMIGNCLKLMSALKFPSMQHHLSFQK